MNDETIVDIWIGLKEYFDKKHIDAIASKYIDILADNGVRDQVLRAALGSDDELDSAIEYYLDDQEFDWDSEFSEED